MKIEVFKKFYPDKPTRGFWRHYFRARAANGEIIFQSEPYNQKRERDKTVRLIRRTNWSNVDVKDLGEAERY